MNSGNFETLSAEVGDARGAVEDAANVVASAEAALQDLETRKRKRRAGASKAIIEKAKQTLEEAIKSHKDLSQAYALKETELASAQRTKEPTNMPSSGLDKTHTSSPLPEKPVTENFSNSMDTDNDALPTPLTASTVSAMPCTSADVSATPLALPDVLEFVDADGDINMRHEAGGDSLGSQDLLIKFKELLELSEKKLMDDGAGIYKQGLAILSGYEATSASFRSELRNLEPIFADLRTGKGVSPMEDPVLVASRLQEAEVQIGRVREGLERAEKTSKEILATIRAGCRSSALIDLLQLTRDRITTKGVGIAEAGKWKELFHLAEDELRVVDEQALFAFRLGIPEDASKKTGAATKKENEKETEKKEPKKDKEQKAKVDDGDKKPVEALRVREQWVEMSPEDQEKLQARAEAAINLYLDDGTAIEPSLRRKIREVVELAPRAGTTSRKLSLHILERSYIICRHHGRYRTEDSFAKYDTFVSIEGVGFRKDYTQPMQENHIACGCSIELALFDFFWFKTWSVGSSHPKFTHRENLKCDTISPRLRSFFVEAYKLIGMITLDDLFGLKWGTGGFDERLRRLQISRMVEYLQFQGLSVAGFQEEPGSSGDMGAE